MSTITAAQIRAARALLNWSQAELAKASKLSIPTVQRMETKGPATSTAANADAIQRALEEAGILFLAAGEANPSGQGVSLRG